MTGKCISQSCAMDISVCQSTTFSLLHTTKYPFTCHIKKSTPLPVKLPVQISVTLNDTVLNSRFYHSFPFLMATQGVMGHLIRKTICIRPTFFLLLISFSFSKSDTIMTFPKQSVKNTYQISQYI